VSVPGALTDMRGEGRRDRDAQRRELLRAGTQRALQGSSLRTRDDARSRDRLGTQKAEVGG
jgi:hypothetical protein